MAPSLTGRGWGWVVSTAAEAVSRFPGPPLEDPPTSPPRNSTGARGGSAVGRLAHGLPLPHGRRSVAADVPARLAQRLQRSRPHDHEQRRLCGRRATERSEWRGGRAAASTSLHPVFSGPAPGLAGDRGGDLAGAAPSGAQRSDLQAGQFAKRASFTRSVKETGPAIPGHGKGPPRASAGSAGLTVLRQGWKPVRGETPVPRWLGAQRNSPAPRSGETPRPTETWHQRHHRTHHHNPQHQRHQQLKPGRQWTRSQHRTSDTTRPSPNPPSPRLPRSAGPTPLPPLPR